MAVSFTKDGAIATSTRRLPDHPAVAQLPEATASVFDASDALESHQHNTAGAIANMRPLSQSPDPAVRAGALIRLARNFRASGDTDRVLAADPGRDHHRRRG